MSVVAVVLLAAAFGAAVVAIGWWAVPVLAALFGIVASTRRPGRTAGAAAALAHAVLLARALSRPVGGTFAARLAGAMTLPRWAPVVASVLFPAILAALAARTAAGLARRAPGGEPALAPPDAAASPDTRSPLPDDRRAPAPDPRPAP